MSLLFIISEQSLRYCESPSVGTCCTYNMETRMAIQSRTQLESHTKEQISRMSGILGSKATKFNGTFSQTSYSTSHLNLPQIRDFCSGVKWFCPRSIGKWIRNWQCQVAGDNADVVRMPADVAVAQATDTDTEIKPNSKHSRFCSANGCVLFILSSTSPPQYWLAINSVHFSLIRFRFSSLSGRHLPGPAERVPDAVQQHVHPNLWHHLRTKFVRLLRSVQGTGELLRPRKSGLAGGHGQVLQHTLPEDVHRPQYPVYLWWKVSTTISKV